MRARDQFLLTVPAITKGENMTGSQALSIHWCHMVNGIYFLFKNVFIIKCEKYSLTQSKIPMTIANLKKIFNTEVLCCFTINVMFYKELIGCCML